MGGMLADCRYRSRVRALDGSVVRGGELDCGVSDGCFESANGESADNDVRVSEGCMKGSMEWPVRFLVSPKDGVGECTTGRGECSMSFSGTPSTDSRDFSARWFPSALRERWDSEECRPVKMRLALRVTPSSMDGPTSICDDKRAAFRRCRSAISHRFKVCRGRSINAQWRSEKRGVYFFYPSRLSGGFCRRSCALAIDRVVVAVVFSVLLVIGLPFLPFARTGAGRTSRLDFKRVRMRHRSWRRR